MMIFNSFIAAKDYNFFRRLTAVKLSRCFADKKTFEGLSVLALVGIFLQKKLWIIPVFETTLHRVTQDIICILKQIFHRSSR